MNGELRVYINGHKDFCPFDIAEFNNVMRSYEKSGEPFRNYMIEHALSVATGNKCINGSKINYGMVEWMARDKSGNTI